MMSISKADEISFDIKTHCNNHRKLDINDPGKIKAYNALN